MNMLFKAILAATLAASTFAVKTNSSTQAVAEAISNAIAMEVDSKGDGLSSNPYDPYSQRELNYAYQSGFYNGYTNARST